LREFYGNGSLFFEIKKVEKRIVPSAQISESPAPKSNGSLKASAPLPTMTIDDSVERSELELALIKEFGAIPL
jgi:hypothetical protein